MTTQTSVAPLTTPVWQARRPRRLSGPAGAVDAVAWLLAAVVTIGTAVGRGIVGSDVYGVNPVWSSVGVGTAAFVLAPRWGKVLVGLALPAYMVVSAALVGSPLEAAVIVAVGGTAASAAAALVLVRSGVRSIDSMGAFGFLALAAALGAACVGVGGLLLSGAEGADGPTAGVAALANATAILVWCPVLLQRPQRTYDRYSARELALQVATMLALCALLVLVGGFVTAVASTAVFVALSWAGLQFGVRVTAIELVVLSAIGVLVWLVGAPLHVPMTGIHEGPLANVERSWSIGVFVGTAALWALPLAIVGDQRRDAERRVVRELRAMEVARARFVATASHELRTPVTNALGRLDLLQEGVFGPLTDEQQGVVETTARNVERLADLVESLVLLTQVDGPATCPPRAVRLDEVVRHCVTVERERAGASCAGLSIDVRLGEVVVTGDEALLTSAVRHLVRNALTFGEHRVCVQVGRVRGTDGAFEAVVTVENDGVPILGQERDSLFESFYRGGYAEKWAIQGSGVGLAIVRAAAERHGGSARVVSAEGDGAKFEIRVPCGG
ncbi:HAMP domain-containing histidine kinase [Nocardioides sp. ChNu-153]|uniref:sensor histidine kinase n=1 Tax=unclassified Nocardioides TaxID=2615069 RepID=UPI002406FFD0|nr:MULTISPECIES: HAMP domain-containing sensor histidine kinase [unclassified Nocardioides]MDF9715035.1 HAMP domain-containing histidine kinase [Nocardioides sp. ChNu-99]MDN7122304.1 HAMP domain-containing histidine kinase [Nocardioides sp. ChNu-153]